MSNKPAFMRRLQKASALFVTAGILGTTLAAPSFADWRDHRDHRDHRSDDWRRHHDGWRGGRPGYGYGYGYGAPAYVQAPPPVVYGPPPPPAGLNFLFSFR